MSSRQVSEYDGGGTMRNTVHPKGTEAITASDALRLMSLTGQETDTKAPVDPLFWLGLDNNDPRPAANEPLVPPTRVNDRYRETKRGTYGY